jgi:hypothetical protein
VGESFPVVYVRGFAGTQGAIDQAVNNPFYGLNDGATHVRVNGDGDPQYYQFEGPLLRLISDEGYHVLVYGDQQSYLNACPKASLSHQTVWVYRFYDAAATTLGKDAQDFHLQDAAARLLTFIQLVLEKTGAAKVFLVAHSMGGLVCRSMLQKVCPEAGVAATGIVDKFFTFATPHGGIAFSPAGFLHIVVPEWAPFGAQVFNTDKMYEYLTPVVAAGPDKGKLPDQPPNWDPRDMPATAFDAGRTFCLIGTDAADYGEVSKAVGPKSDGLVQIDNAYVRNANRAFVHRSHSGIYGEVNSEEGYQNLHRFLFGNRRAKVYLHNLQLPTPDKDDVAHDITDVWQAELRLSIRGLPVVVSEQVAAHFCPIQLGAAAAPRPADSPDTPVPLTAVFLLAPDRDTGRRDATGQLVSPRCRYTLHLTVLHLQQRHGAWYFNKITETAADWDDILLVDVGPGVGDPAGSTTTRLFAAWNSEVRGVNSAKDPIGPELTPDTTTPGTASFTVNLTPAGAAILGPKALIKINVTNWS